MMNNLQKMGGVAALINAVAYMVGIGLAFTYLLPLINDNPEGYIGVIANNKTFLIIWHIMIYLVAGVFMVPLVLALHERLKHKLLAMMQITTTFGLIWVTTIISSGMIIINNLGIVKDLYVKDPDQAMTVWLALSAVEGGLGGSIELPGGLWILLVSLVALQSSGFPKLLNYLGVLIGLSGLLTVVPSFYEVGNVFGIGAIVWFIWVGIVLLRGDRSTVT